MIEETDLEAVWDSEDFFAEEDDFTEYMSAKVAPWLEKEVKEGFFESSDGKKIHYHYALRPAAKRVVVISHGFCESFCKYHEFTYYLYQAGFSVFFIEHRGHGFSYRMCDNIDMVKIDDFDTYVEDFSCFIEKAVRPIVGSDVSLALYSHSMGGCIGALFLEKYSGVFDRAVLSSPMFTLRANDNPRIVIQLMLTGSRLLGWGARYMPSQGDFDYDKVSFEGSSCASRARFEYFMSWKRRVKEYRTYGGCYAWGWAAYKAMPLAIRNAARITVPVLLCQAGNDGMVTPYGQVKFAKQNPSHVKISVYPEAKHELFNAVSPDRERYYREVLGFLSE